MCSHNWTGGCELVRIPYSTTYWVMLELIIVQFLRASVRKKWQNKSLVFSLTHCPKKTREKMKGGIKILLPYEKRQNKWSNGGTSKAFFKKLLLLHDDGTQCMAS